MSEQTPEFISKKYNDLAGSKEVSRAVDMEKSQGLPSPKSKEQRIEKYFTRIDHLITAKNAHGENRGLELLKNKIISTNVIAESDEETISELAKSLYEEEFKIATERGQGADIQNLTESEVFTKYKPEVTEKLQTQKKSLEYWIDYLSSSEATYPMWFKYYATRSLLKMGKLDKAKQTYSNRSKKTLLPFPELNCEALANVYNQLIRHSKLPNNDSGVVDTQINQENQIQIDPNLEKLLEKADFSSLYANAQLETLNREMSEGTAGEWVKYNRGSDHMSLYSAIHGKGTGWCTAGGETTAKSHVDGGDFYVYYSYDKTGAASLPRIAIRMEGNRLAEVRGVKEKQELEPELLDIAQEKYHTLPGGEKFDKKTADMKKMTELARKSKQGIEFSQDDIMFIYELNNKIEGFGYQDDPRIKEVRESRDVLTDMEKVDKKYANSIAVILTNTISSGKLKSLELEKAIGLIESCGNKEAIALATSRIVFGRMPDESIEPILDFIERNGSVKAADNLFKEITDLMPTRHLERVMNLMEKYGEEKYDRKIQDHRRVLDIESKQENKIGLTQDEIEFIYEVDREIERFGRLKNPRIEKIIKNRNIVDDLKNLSIKHSASLDLSRSLIEKIHKGELIGEDLGLILRTIKNSKEKLASINSEEYQTHIKYGERYTYLAQDLADLIKNNRLDGDNFESALAYIEDNGDYKARDILAESLGVGKLNEDGYFDRAIAFIESGIWSQAANHLAKAIANNNLNGRHLEKVFSLVESNANYFSNESLIRAISNKTLPSVYIDRALAFIELKAEPNIDYVGDLISAIKYYNLEGETEDKFVAFVKKNGNEKDVASLEDFLAKRQKRENSLSNRAKRFFNNVFKLQKTA